MHKRNRAGNILFLILLAVVLFAALAYAVTSSMRGGGRDASNERLDTFAAQLLQQMSLIESTILRAMLMNDIKPWGFNLSGTNSPSASNGACTSEACRLFAGSAQPNHGIAIQELLPPYAVSATNPSFMWVQVEGIGTAAEDVILTYSVSRPFCEAINRVLGYTDIDLTAGEAIAGTHPARLYSGTLTGPGSAGGRLGEDGTGRSFLRGKNVACYYNTGGVPATFMFYYVLLPQ